MERGRTRPQCHFSRRGAPVHRAVPPPPPPTPEVRGIQPPPPPTPITPDFPPVGVDLDDFEVRRMPAAHASAPPIPTWALSHRRGSASPTGSATIHPSRDEHSPPLPTALWEADGEWPISPSSTAASGGPPRHSAWRGGPTACMAAFRRATVRMSCARPSGRVWAQHAPPSHEHARSSESPLPRRVGSTFRRLPCRLHAQSARGASCGTQTARTPRLGPSATRPAGPVRAAPPRRRANVRGGAVTTARPCGTRYATRRRHAPRPAVGRNANNGAR